MHGARTTAKCVIGAVKQVTISKTVIALGIAVTAHTVAMMALTVFIPMTFVTNSRIVRFTLLTPTLNVATVPPLTITLMSKGR